MSLVDEESINGIEEKSTKLPTIDANGNLVHNH